MTEQTEGEQPERPTTFVEDAEYRRVLEEMLRLQIEINRLYELLRGAPMPMLVEDDIEVYRRWFKETRDAD